MRVVVAGNTVVLAWLRDDSLLVIREGDGNLAWQPEVVIPAALCWNEASRIDLWISGDAISPPKAWLTVAGGPYADQTILYCTAASSAGERCSSR